MAELIPEAEEVFQANQITAGHAALIARLPQEQQVEAFKATFRVDWQSKEKHAVSVRELGQWIRVNLMLTLADSVFDAEDAQLVPAAGSCAGCIKRTGANTALFDNFQQDDRCMLRGIWPVGKAFAKDSETQFLACFGMVKFQIDLPVLSMYPDPSFRTTLASPCQKSSPFSNWGEMVHKPSRSTYPHLPPTHAAAKPS
jgi:hypothetical protein